MRREGASLSWKHVHAQEKVAHPSAFRPPALEPLEPKGLSIRNLRPLAQLQQDVWVEEVFTPFNWHLPGEPGGHSPKKGPIKETRLVDRSHVDSLGFRLIQIIIVSTLLQE